MEEPIKEYKIISIDWTSHGWRRLLELELNDLAYKGWKPILNSDSGQQYTVILERVR